MKPHFRNREIVFIDSKVENYQSLVSGITHSVGKVYLLDAAQNGVIQIRDILADDDTVDAIHIVSHGQPGSIQLGTAHLNLETLNQYADLVQDWTRSLSRKVDILLYGCQVAAEQIGLSFIAMLGRLTGANVAASTTRIGNSAQQGNWELDATVGTITTKLAFRSEVMEAYSGVLNDPNNPFAGITPVDPVVSGQVGAAKITITPASGIQTSNYATNSFKVENVGSKRIAAVYFDVTNALYPDTVFDPIGLAGDSVSRGLTFGNTGGTGVFQPGSGQVLVPFFGAGGTAGYEGMLLKFDPNVNGGYQPGESVLFGVDMDPNSIVGLPQQPVDINGNNPRLNSWDVGGVSGAELINSKVTVLFTDGTTAVGELQSDASQGGAIAVASQSTPNKQVTLTVNGIAAGGSGSYTQSDVQVLVSGQAGDTARVVLTKGFIQPFNYIAPNGTPVNVSQKLVGSPFPANNALQFQTVDVVLTGGVQDITSLFNFGAPGGNLSFSGDNVLPIGFTASIVDANKVPIGPVTEPIYLVHEDANPIPSNAGVTLTQSGGNTAVTEGGATDSYSVVLNSQPTANVTVSLGINNGQVTTTPASLTFTPTNWNVAQNITVAAVNDTVVEGNHSSTITHTITSTDTNYNNIPVAPVSVAIADNDSMGGGAALRINVGGGQYTDTQGQVWQADTFFSGGKVYTKGNAIANTVEDTLYHTERFGNFSYAIPVTNGVYDINLLFAEIYWNDPNKRIFDVKAEGQLLINDLDLVADVGANTAVTKALNNINVTDGVLNLEFTTELNNAKLSAIEILPDGTNPPPPAGVTLTQSGGNTAVTEGGATDSYSVVLNSQPTANVTVSLGINNGQVTTTPASLTFTPTNWNVAQNITVAAVNDTVVEGNHSSTITHTITSTDTSYNNLPVSSVEVAITDNDSGGDDAAIRINTGGGQYTDTLGRVWQADTYFSGGSVFSVPNTTEIFKTEDDPLYRNERFAKNLSYQIPVAQGSYTVNLHFAELYWDAPNQRVFDVNIEGNLAVDNLDIHQSSQNAFFPGKFSALVQSSSQVFVNDGTLNIDLSASVNNASIAAIEVIPLQGPAVLINPTNGSTQVSESGGNDTYSVVLNTQPTANVTIALQKDNQINLDKTTLTFTPSNWNVPQVVSVTAVDDTVQEGTHVSTVNYTVSSADNGYNSLSVASTPVTIVDNDVAAISFTKKVVATTGQPTVGTWGPDGRLYVGSYGGTITAYTFDDNYNVIATQTIATIKNLYNAQILGIAFNPFEPFDQNGQPVMYVSHSKLYANGGKSFPQTQLSPYSGQVSTLTGPNFSTATPLITGIGVSNHDHGVNGLEFDAQGNLLIAVGGNTNAGIPNDNIGGLPESPFTAAILKADITKANFNGKIEYLVPPGSVVPTSFPTGYQPPAGETIGPDDHQVNGGAANVAPGVDVSVYASGLRNSFDLTYTTKGLIYATDNGANVNFGDVSTSATTQQPFTQNTPDELNLIVGGAYYGHPNRNRGRFDDRQNVYYNPNSPTTSDHTAPLAKMGASTNGIVEYRAATFGGQMRGNLLAQKWNGNLFRFTLSENGQQVVKQETLNNVVDGLDLLTGPGGALVSIDLSQNNIAVATPNDAAATGVTVYDIFPWRAPATGGQSFVIGGANFGNLANTTVSVGGQQAQLDYVSSSRIKGVLPTLAPTGNDLLDIVVSSGGQTSILPDAFLPV